MWFQFNKTKPEKTAEHNMINGSRNFFKNIDLHLKSNYWTPLADCCHTICWWELLKLFCTRRWCCHTVFKPKFTHLVLVKKERNKYALLKFSSDMIVVVVYLQISLVTICINFLKAKFAQHKQMFNRINCLQKTVVESN